MMSLAETVSEIAIFRIILTVKVKIAIRHFLKKIDQDQIRLQGNRLLVHY